MNQKILNKIHRRKDSKKDDNNNYIDKNNIKTLPNESSDEMEPLPSCPSGEGIAQDKADIKILECSLKSLSPKWKNWTVRGIFGIIMISSFSFIVILGKNYFLFFKFQVSFLVLKLFIT